MHPTFQPVNIAILVLYILIKNNILPFLHISIYEVEANKNAIMNTLITFLNSIVNISVLITVKICILLFYSSMSIERT